MPAKEGSKKERVEAVIEELRLAMLEDIYANDTVTKAEIRKKTARFRLQKAREEVAALQQELKS